MPESTKAAIAGNTAIKYAGPVSLKDARFLSGEMYTTPDFIRDMKKHSKTGPTEFAVHVRGTPQAIRLTVPFGTVENAPKFVSPEPNAAPPSAELPSAETTSSPQPPSPDDPYKATKLT
jgi:hypothetical protein